MQVGSQIGFMALKRDLPLSLVYARRLINNMSWSKSGKCYVVCI